MTDNQAESQFTEEQLEENFPTKEEWEKVKSILFKKDVNGETAKQLSNFLLINKYTKYVLPIFYF